MAIETHDIYGRAINIQEQIEMQKRFKSNDKKHMKNKQKEKIMQEFDKRFFIPMGYRNSHMADRLKQFFSQSLDSIREETLRKVERGLVHSLPDLLNKKTKENLKVWYFLFFRNLINNLKTKDENSN